MKKRLAPIVIGVGLIGLAGCAGGNDSGDSENGSSDSGETEFGDVLATSDAGEVTSDDILNQIGTDQVANQTFQLTLDTILQDKYSDEVDVEEVESQVDEQVEQMGGEEQFSMMLQQQQPGVTVEDYKQQRVNNAYHDQFFQEQFEITDEEAIDSVREASHILIGVQPEEGEQQQQQQQMQQPQSDLTDEEAQEKANSLKEELDNGADFGELASENSDDQGSAQNNGQLGYVQQGQMVEEFENTLWELEPGEVSEPVQSENGYHIIKRHEEENIEEDLPTIKQQVVNQRIQENQDQVLQFYRDVLEEYNAEFENEEIRSFIEDTYLNPESEESTEQGSGSGGESAEESTEEASSEEESTEE